MHSVRAGRRFPVQYSSISQRVLGLTLSDCWWILWFNVLFFANYLQDSFGFSYADELAVGVLSLGALIRFVRQRGCHTIGRYSLCVTACTALFALICLLGNLFSGLGTNLSAIVTDAVACLKFPIAFICAVAVFSERPRRVTRAVQFEAKLLILIMLIFGAANLIFDLGMGLSGRYGIRSSYMFIFSHPTYLVFASVGLSVVLMQDKKRNEFWIGLSLLVVALSLRSKGFAYVGVVILLHLLLGTRGKMSILKVALCAGMAIAIGYGQFVTYFDADGFARTELLRSSFIVARDFAPLGSGFATFGSAVTAEPAYYSPLYVKYGLSAIQGLQLGNTVFLSDVFWPIVLAQSGVFGSALYLLLVLFLFQFSYCISPNGRFATIACFAYLLISSTSESSFFNPQSVYLAMCLALAVAPQIVSSDEKGCS